MTHVESVTAGEIADQPECWERAAAESSRWEGLLPPGERLAVVGCGTSLFMAQSFAALRERAGQGETDAFPASEYPDRRYDRVLALTRSGTTTEVCDALAAVRGSVPTVAITATGQAPVSRLADRTVLLDFADERSVVQTRFATSALLLLRAQLGEPVGPLVAAARRALVEELPDGAVEREQFTFLGRGWTVGIANEAALKLREAARVWTEAYPAMEYRHGPISVTDERSLVWALGESPAGLPGEVRAAGGSWVCSVEDPLAELVRIQRLAVRLAHHRGIDPDRPRNLRRSVILSANPPADGGASGAGETR
ncbi:SIS domain-containing protein [Haloechinothrix sp. LS1_15]|uniref:SIS domain-containing protein n=1 Tax=Haloechinothrix sp. LS1_15 TaxID=2652248 RepID=UPI0029459E3F|nr:SIS domain-containing protein [Haloechinothrix sp. LS1_15]MDV6012126.1 SIS domain-containing protein [Haloechinothrix sp. LS1_15]